MTSKWVKSTTVRLELLGVGSARNRELKANLEEALRQLEIDVPIEEVSDIDRLLQYDISGIPAVVVNGKVVFQRVVPSVEDIKIVLQVLLQPRQNSQPVKGILVPIDFSETAENAFRFALELAEVFSADVRVVHVHQPFSEFGGPLRLEVTADNGAYKERLMRALCDRFKRAKADRPALAGIKVTTEIVSGQVVEEINRLSRREDIDLVIMGNTGEGGLFGRWFGSTSSQVARNSDCPVILVPEGVEFKRFDRIIYASSYDPSEERILPQMIDFANPFGASIYFAHIEENRLSPYQVMSTPDGRIFRSHGLTFHLATIESKDVVEGLSRFAEETRADLMVMSTTHRNSVEELFHKSATRRMIFNTRIPLMILHF